MNMISKPGRESGDLFPTGIEGLPDAVRPATLRLYDGDHVDLSIHPVRLRLGDATIRMLGYNRSIPGPTLQVDQGSEITVRVANDGDFDTTVHWHGLRLDNRFDGVPHDTQAPIPVGGAFSYRVRFPDPGLYWYHPHLREDVAQELGLYGPILVNPTDPSYWPAADRHMILTLDDIYVEGGGVVPFRRSGPTFTAMGRFGNVMLINGDTGFSGRAAVGEVVRLYLVNTANTRIFNLAVTHARMKLVGGDSGRYERETFVDSVLLAPSERAVVDVQFDTPGRAGLEHRTPDRIYDLGGFTVEAGTAGAGRSFATLRTDPDLATERHLVASAFDRRPDKTLAFVSRMPLLYGEKAAVTSEYVCPMHPEVRATEPATCPKCGMRLIPAPAPSPRDTTAQTATVHGGSGQGDGLEWEDLMPEINRASDPTNMIWQIVDRDTGAENAAIDWAFTVGDRVKIRLINDMDSDHPMHHPFHIHGAGRFLILARDGITEPNLAWKDTVLVPAGRTIDILLDVTNPGRWMAHCHIAEHMESNMMFSFDVSMPPKVAAPSAIGEFSG